MLEAEAQAILDGLLFDAEFGFPKIIVKSHSRRAIATLKVRQESLGSECSIFSDVRVISLNFLTVVFARV